MRVKCHRCHYPLKTCLCKYIAPVFNSIEVIVLQHPKEVGHAKNTVRLLQLSLQHIQCYPGKSAEDFIALQEQLKLSKGTTAVLYPAPEAVELTVTTCESDISNIERLIVLDGSWKQVFGMWKRNPWLNAFPFLCLPKNLEGQYGIRKTSVTNGLSTLEAVAHSLQCLEKTDVKPLYGLLDAFKQQWNNHIQHN